MYVEEQPSRVKPQQIEQDYIIEHVASPLEYEVNVKNEESAVFCGGNFDSILKSDVYMEIDLPVRSPSYKRKPIFDKKMEK